MTSGAEYPPAAPDVALTLGTMAEESEGDALCFEHLDLAKAPLEAHDIAVRLVRQARERVPLCVTDEQRAKRLARFERRLGRRMLDVNLTLQLLEEDREKRALVEWAVQTGLPLNCRARVVQGPWKNRIGQVMPFGQRAGVVLLGLDAAGGKQQELVRVPRKFVAFHAAAPSPVPSAVSKDGALDMSALWSRAAGKLEYAAG